MIEEDGWITRANYCGCVLLVIFAEMGCSTKKEAQMAKVAVDEFRQMNKQPSRI